jgi:putative oxidoreductase
MLRQETWSFTNPPVRRDHVSMKILTHISRFLLGLIFLVFGLNGFLHFIPMPPPSGVAGQFLGAMFVSKYLLVVSGLQVISGALLLINRYVPLALTILGPIIVNILLFHSLMSPAGIGLAVFVTILWGVVFVSVRSAFAGIFQARVDMKTAPARRYSQAVSPA